MNCSAYTLSGLNSGCKDSMGGIKEVYIADFDDVASKTLNSAGDKIEAITMNANKKFKTFKLRKNTSSITSTMQVSDTAGNYFQNDLTLQFMKMETAKRTQMMALLMGECVAIVLDSNGKYWYLGYDYPIEASSGTAQSGTAAGDLNGYDLTLSDTSKELPYEVDMAIGAWEAIIDPAPVSAN